MKKLLSFILLFILGVTAFLTLASCKDTPEKLVEDSIEAYIELCEVLEAYDTGKISESEAIEELERINEKYGDLDERFEKLKEEGAVTDDFGQDEDMIAKMKPYQERLIRVFTKLQMAERLTPAMLEALSIGP